VRLAVQMTSSRGMAELEHLPNPQRQLELPLQRLLARSAYHAEVQGMSFYS
jgi:hypothetical protein